MNLKRVIGSHIDNLNETVGMQRVFQLDRLVPMLSLIFLLDEVGQAARLVQNTDTGKAGVRRRPDLG